MNFVLKKPSLFLSHDNFLILLSNKNSYTSPTTVHRRLSLQIDRHQPKWYIMNVVAGKYPNLLFRRPASWQLCTQTHSNSSNQKKWKIVCLEHIGIHIFARK